jgi:hypothetical protein
MLDHFQSFWNYPEVPLYDEQYYKNQYLKHNDEVEQYFVGRDKLLVVNVGIKGDFARLGDFLGVETTLENFPWENRGKIDKRS